MSVGGELSDWRSIPGYEGFFDISAQGYILAQSKIVKTTKGYLIYKGGMQERNRIINLNKEGRGIEVLHSNKTLLNNQPVAELVLRAFRGPPLNDQFKLKYLDNNPDNFSLSNLVWTTPRLKLTDDAVKSLSKIPREKLIIQKIPRERLTNGVLRDESAA